MTSELRLPFAVWVATSALLIVVSLQFEAAIYAAAIYIFVNGASFGLGMARRPPFAPRTIVMLGWCTALQLPTMLTVLFDTEANQNPRKQAMRQAESDSD